MSARNSPTVRPVDSRPRCFVCIDIEARGFSPMRHGINAIGLSVHDSTGKRIDKQMWALDFLPYQTFEPACLEEFWLASDVTRALLDAFAKVQVPAAEAIAEFYEFIARLCDDYKVTIIGDAPGYDAPFISYYLDYHGYPPLVMLPNKRYKPTPVAEVKFDNTNYLEKSAAGVKLCYSALVDTISYANGAAKQCIRCDGQGNKASMIAKMGITVGDAVYDHNPSNDADFIARTFFATCDVLCENHAT